MAVVVEDFVRYRDSVAWRIHDAYFAEAGVAPWDCGVIPSRITSNGGIARQHADLLGALAAERDPSRPFTVLEVGAGSGGFAAELVGVSGADLRERLRYVASDCHAATVREIAARPHLAGHVAAGRVVPAALDLRDGTRPLDLAGAELDAPPAAIIANYVACVLATAYIRRRGGAWEELHVKVLRDDATKRGYRLRHRWCSTRLDDALGDPFHVAVAERAVATTDGDVTLAYPLGLIDALRRLGPSLASGGCIMISDFGDPAAVPGNDEARRPRVYGRSLNHAVQFAVLDGFAAEAGWWLDRTHAPSQPLQHALLAPSPPSRAVAAAFRAAFVERHDGVDLLDFLAAARALLETGELARARRFFARAIDLAPTSVALRHEIGLTCLHADEPAAAAEYLEECLALEGAGAVDCEFSLGLAAMRRGRSDEAIAWYRRSAARDPDPATHWNLALAHLRRYEVEDAVAMLERTLDLAPDHVQALALAERLRGAH